MVEAVQPKREPVVIDRVVNVATESFLDPGRSASTARKIIDYKLLIQVEDVLVTNHRIFRRGLPVAM